MLPASAQSARTEIRRIDRNFPENVQRYTRRWGVARRDQVLTSGNWLATGSNSMAWMWYSRFGVIYRQYSETISQFVPDTMCGFRVTSGSNIFLDQGRVPGCEQIAGNVRIGAYSVASALPSDTVVAAEGESVASAYLVFRSPSQERTIIGALATPDGRPIEVESLAQGFTGPEGVDAGNSLSLTAGQFAIVSDSGQVTRGVFSLEEFYENSPLALGLGDSPADREYFEGLESPIERELFGEIRSATIAALRAQPRAGAFELREIGRGLPSVPTAPVCSAAEFADVNEDGNLEIFSCFN